MEPRLANKVIKPGTVVMWRGVWGHAIPQQTKIDAISLGETEGCKYGLPCAIVWAIDKDRCIFDLENGKWAYGHQIELIPDLLEDAKI